MAEANGKPDDAADDGSGHSDHGAFPLTSLLSALSGQPVARRVANSAAPSRTLRYSRSALVLAITLAFRGAVVGSRLGDAVSLQIRGVDYLAVAVTVFLSSVASDANVVSSNGGSVSAPVAAGGL